MLEFIRVHPGLVTVAVLAAFVALELYLRHRRGRRKDKP